MLSSTHISMPGIWLMFYECYCCYCYSMTPPLKSLLETQGNPLLNGIKSVTTLWAPSEEQEKCGEDLEPQRACCWKCNEWEVVALKHSCFELEAFLEGLTEGSLLQPPQKWSPHHIGPFHSDSEKLSWLHCQAD